jgi:very-short-patch-repair endonuclease
MNKQELIKIIKNINNIFKYSIKGGTSMFNKEYPNLLNHINNYTSEMQVYSKNKILIAKLLYLKKYDGDISKIKTNNKINIYDNKINDFKEAYINAAKKQWNNDYNELNKITTFYSKEETINLLKNTYLEYLGKSGNRKLLKDNKKLYLSVFEHTKHLDVLNKNYNKFSMRLYILINNVNINCNIHNRRKNWKFNNGIFEISCSKCNPQYPSIEWFKKTYGNNWKFYHQERKYKLKSLKTNSLSWYIENYGNEIGKIKYHNSNEKRINNLVKLKGNRYSKISQELFWSVYNQLNNKDKIYFYELNQEYVIRIPQKYNFNNSVMIVDFIQGNKIIEYNGEYWHTKEKDNKRLEILNNMGYDVLYVSSDTYHRNNKDNSIVNKCVKFLEC